MGSGRWIASRAVTSNAVTLAVTVGDTECGRIRTKQCEPMILQSQNAIDDLDGHTKVSYNSGHNEY